MILGLSQFPSARHRKGILLSICVIAGRGASWTSRRAWAGTPARRAPCPTPRATRPSRHPPAPSPPVRADTPVSPVEPCGAHWAGFPYLAMASDPPPTMSKGYRYCSVGYSMPHGHIAMLSSAQHIMLGPCMAGVHIWWVKQRHGLPRRKRVYNHESCVSGDAQTAARTRRRRLMRKRAGPRAWCSCTRASATPSGAWLHTQPVHIRVSMSSMLEGRALPMQRQLLYAGLPHSSAMSWYSLRCMQCSSPSDASSMQHLRVWPLQNVVGRYIVMHCPCSYRPRKGRFTVSEWLVAIALPIFVVLLGAQPPVGCAVSVCRWPRPLTLQV